MYFCTPRAFLAYIYRGLCHARLKHFKRQTIIVFEEQNVQGKCESAVFRPIKKCVRALRARAVQKVQAGLTTTIRGPLSFKIQFTKVLFLCVSRACL